MDALRHILSVTVVAGKRLGNHLGLTLSIVIGLSTAIALAVGIPIYSDAVHTRMLAEELASEGRPPYAVMYWYLGSNAEPLDQEEIDPLDRYIVETTPGVIGLPLALSVRHVATDYMRLFPADAGLYETTDQVLEWPALGFVTGFEEHIEIIEGHAPSQSPAPGTVEVLVHRELAELMGLNVEERYVMVGSTRDETSGRERQIQIEVILAGVWLPKDETEPFWFYRPRAFAKVFMVPERVFLDRIGSLYEEEIYKQVWYHVYDGAGVAIEEVSRLRAAFTEVRSQIGTRLKGASVALSPEDAMRQYQRQSFNLVLLLYVFSIPVLGLVLYFVSLISGMVVERQRNEIALLRSRGTSRMQIFAIYILEGVIIGSVSVVVGVFAGRILAGLMGSADSFLAFARESALEPRISRVSIFFALIALLLALITTLWPAIGATRHTIVTFKREQARSHASPLWQRFFVDFALLIPVAYGYYALSRRGTISILGRGAVVGDPFNNPILFLVPSLFVLAGSLVFLRYFPLIMEGLARLSERLKGASFLLALRSLARSARQYSGPLMLLMLTVGLAAFTVSMARTLDAHLIENAYYVNGGDYRIREQGELVGAEGEEDPAGGQEPSGARAAATDEEEAHWEFLPAFDYLNAPGVQAVTRVGRYRVRIRWAAARDEGMIAGVDREDLLQVAQLRRDYMPFAPRRLVDALGVEPSALLVERTFVRDNRLAIGDIINLTVYMLGQWVEMDFLIAGIIEYFPGLYPEDGPFFVANLEYLFGRAGGLYAYDIWVKADPALTTPVLEDGLRALGLPGRIEGDARLDVAAEKARPERQGFFGLLSVGFISAALTTALGFLIYALISFQRRAIELGVLRSIGLSQAQMIAYVVGEQLSLVVIGVSAGTGLGMAAGLLFVPFLQVGVGEHAQTPPFLVQIPWSDVALILTVFGTMLLMVIAATVWLLRNMKIFQAVKMEDVT
jgi:putative ABC transport system permease protein